MAESSADRQRRYRRHKAGDHGLCIPGRCPSVTPVEMRNAPPSEAPVLGPSGRRLWDEMTANGPLPPMHAVLLLEACRITDRLDQLDGQLRGKDWLRFHHDDEGVEVVVIVDKALSESRQQATALKQIVAELRQGAAVRSGARRTSMTGSAKGGGGVVTDLAAAAARRRASTTA